MKEIQIGDTGGIPVPDETYDKLVDAYQHLLNCRVSVIQAYCPLKKESIDVREFLYRVEKEIVCLSMLIEDMTGLEVDE